MKILSAIILTGLISGLMSQSLLWDYYYEGTGNWTDYAGKIIYGPDHNIYVCGTTCEAPYTYDFTFTVMSFDTLGNRRWMYQNNTINNGDDEATNIVFGGDGNLYVCGSLAGKFSVISLTTSGAQRWVYQDPLDGLPYDIEWCAGNIFVTGFVYLDAHDIYTLSLTPTGAYRWGYTYGSLPATDDRAHQITSDANGNIYVCGWTYKEEYPWPLAHLTVLAYNTDGVEKWIFQFDDTSNVENTEGYTVIATGDRVYAGGDWMQGPVVVCLDIAGAQQWFWHRDINSNVHPNSLIMGGDGNLYLSSGDGHGMRITSLTTQGSERWYVDINGGHVSFMGCPIIYGQDGNLYATGIVADTLGNHIPVISLKTDGSFRYIYLHPIRGYGDWGMCITEGENNKVYVGGWSSHPNQSSNKDWIVFGFDTYVGIEENPGEVWNNQRRVYLPGICSGNIPLRMNLPSSGKITVSIYDRIGRKVYASDFFISDGKEDLDLNPSNLSTGVYFLVVNHCNEIYKNKFIFIRR